jgi:hypothetical protein
MQIDPDHFKLLPFLAGVIHDEMGEIRWPIVTAGLATAGIIGAFAATTNMTANISAIDAKQQMVLQRLDRIEASQHPATSKRYTSDDADRDREYFRREFAQITARLEKIESKVGDRR